MRRTIATIVTVTAIAITAAPASAQRVWTNVARNVGPAVLNAYHTSDGRPLELVSCRGLWSSFHVHTSRGLEFHRFSCSEWDDVNRHFTASVTLTGSRGFDVVETACDDRDSTFYCP